MGLLEYLQTCEPHELVRKSDHEYRTVTHGSLVLWHDYWYWNRGCVGSPSALDYLVEVRGMGFVDAVNRLCDARQAPSFAANPPRLKANAPPMRKPFQLPPRHRDHFRVISYLLGRGINREVIDRCIEGGLLYESAQHHNAVFVGRDVQGKARFAALRGTRGNFKLDVPGSDKRHNFRIPAQSKESGGIAVFEAPIDALSHVTLYPKMDCHRLSLGGTSALALVEFLERHPKVRRVVLCLDNDDAGHKAAERITERLRADGRFAGVDIQTDFPPPGMDYNEKMQQHIKRGKDGRHRAAVSL